MLQNRGHFPSVIHYYWESKVCSQPTDLFAQQFFYQHNLSISPAKVQASEEAETGIIHCEQIFTAFNSEFLRYSRTPKRKTKTGMVMMASVFMLLANIDLKSTEYMNEEPDRHNELWTFHFWETVQFTHKVTLKKKIPYVYVLFSKWQRLKFRPKFITVFCFSSFS